MTDSHSEIIADTVKFLPEKNPFPLATTEDYLKKVATDIVALLKHNEVSKINIPREEL